MGVGMRSLKEYLEKEGFIIQPTVGSSMEPLLHSHQSLVRIERVEGELPKNSVPLYVRPSGQYVLHRIVKVRKKDYLIVGDNRVLLEKVPKEWVIGVMTAYAADGILWHMTEDSEYLAYVEGYTRHFWLRHYVKWCRAFPGRVIRKLRCIAGKLKHGEHIS